MIKHPLLRYFSGKFRLAPWIISHFPKHEIYVEAVKRGATAVISNCDNSTTREILHRFKIYEIEAPRTVAANGNRKPAKEIIGVLTPDMV